MKRTYLRKAAPAGVVALSAILCGCFNSDSSQPVESYPPPGQMEVVSATSLEWQGAPSLVANGTFEEWYAGAPKPNGPFEAPGSSSTISPVQRDGGGIALSQVWSAPDDKWTHLGRFATHFANLAPETDYALSLDAKLNSGLPVYFELHGVDPSGELVPMSRRVFMVEAGEEGWGSRDIVFSSGVLTEAVLLTGCFELPESGSQELLLDNIVLTKHGPTRMTPLPRDPENNLVPNGNFSLWLTGKNMPEGPFTAPSPQEGDSTVSRWVAGNPDDPFKYAIVQAWQANDVESDPSSMLGVTIDVTAETEYVFTCGVDTRGKYRAAISIYGLAEDGAYEPVALPVVETTADAGYSRYTNPFYSAQYTKIRIVSHVPEGTQVFPNEAIWFYWVVTEAPAGA